MSYETTGGLFWDVLLLSKYNDDWINFYESLIRVLPCDKCIKDSLHYHEGNPIPKISNNDEKNQFLWELRRKRGSAEWKTKMLNHEYTLESWLDQFKDKPFYRYKY